MKLKEAIEILLDFKWRDVAWGKMDEAIDTVLQVLEELQEENKKYISGELMTRNQVKSFEETTKKYYIQKDKIKEKIEEQTERVNKVLEELLKDKVDKSTGCIILSYLSKKEREEIINKRNCLLVQRATLQQVKEELLKGE